MNSQVYIIDTNALITANRTYYSFELCPGFWDTLRKGFTESKIKSIDRVRKEIEDGNYDDRLKQWVQSLPESYFCNTNDNKVIEQFGEIANWVNNHDQFYAYAKANFMNDKVDGWLVAYALSKIEDSDVVVITHEKYEPTIKKKVKIPNICEAFNIHYEDTFKMLNNLGANFILSEES